MLKTFTLKTNTRQELVNITEQIQSFINEEKITEGICYLHVPHTTAALTINENADPDVCRDIITGLNHLNFEKCNFFHIEGNSDAHIKSSLFGCDQTILISNGELLLGTWQGLYFCEFDGPRTRKVIVKIKKD